MVQHHCVTKMIGFDMIYGYIGSYGHSATSSADAFQQLFQRRDSSRKQYFFVSRRKVFTEEGDVDENGWIAGMLRWCNIIV